MSGSSDFRDNVVKGEFFSILKLLSIEHNYAKNPDKQKNDEAEAAKILYNFKKDSHSSTPKAEPKKTYKDNFDAQLNKFSTFMANCSKNVKNKEVCNAFIKNVMEDEARKRTNLKKIIGGGEELMTPNYRILGPKFLKEEKIEEPVEDLDSDLDESRLVIDEDRISESDTDEEPSTSYSTVILGKNGTKIPKHDLNDILTQNYDIKIGDDKNDIRMKKTTRFLLEYFFSRDVLATSSLTGKPSPAFPHRKPKKALDPMKIEDIVEFVAEKYNKKPKQVRAAITSKCADETKLKKGRDGLNIYKRKREDDWEEDSDMEET